MKTYEIRVTQDLNGWYEGRIEIEATSKKSALKKLKAMKLSEIDKQADWTHGDEYSGDVDSIQIDELEIEEI